MSKSDLVCLGMITSPHGIQGAVKVHVYTEFPEDLTAYGDLQDTKGRFYKILSLRVVSPTTVVITIDGVKDRNAAELLRRTNLYIPRDHLPEPEEEEYYYTDLEGLIVENIKGDIIGKVRSVQNYGAGDFLEIINDENQIFTLPFSKQAVPHVLVSEGKLIIDDDFLLSATLVKEGS
jgi:16S rRNA processing protein RimM